MNKERKEKKCKGNGQGSCKRCSDLGKWNRTWMCFLFEIEGMDGCYCEDCVKEFLKEEMENAVDFPVRLSVDAHVGKTWYEAK